MAELAAASAVAEVAAERAMAAAREAAETRNRAAALVVPIAEATDRPVATPVVVPEKVSGSDQPGAVLPGRPTAPRPILREFADVPDTTGEIACPNCGTQNPADRTFCRKCGQALHTEQAAEKARRRFRFRWPKGLGRIRRLLAVLAILILVAALIWAGMTYGPRAVDAVRDRMATPELVTPDAVTASSSTRGHAPNLVSDGLSNRYWEPGHDKKPWVELTFTKPIRVLSVIVTGGVSPQQQDYARQGRPADVHLELWTPDGTRTEKDLPMVDRAGPQTFEMAVGDVTRMRLTVESGYGLTSGKVPSMAEIEVFRRP
ncbi:NADase-type glycan-binding domain-containing protein [Actinoplanes sp. HUAS TT8]|uniref:NADase-type glycan-binding domain-containing protein n=1 Tax=Actinoplanes sp. HUAS TT8 TaxID=3447453 RepID=UPI003F51DD9A